MLETQYRGDHHASHVRIFPQSVKPFGNYFPRGIGITSIYVAQGAFEGIDLHGLPMRKTGNKVSELVVPGGCKHVHLGDYASSQLLTQKMEKFVVEGVIPLSWDQRLGPSAMSSSLFTSWTCNEICLSVHHRGKGRTIWFRLGILPPPFER